MMQRLGTPIQSTAVRIASGEEDKLPLTSRKVAHQGAASRHRRASACVRGMITLVLLLSMTGSPARGQMRHQETAGAKAQEQRVQPLAAPEVPIDDLNRGTPRGAVEGFLHAANARDFQRAAQYLDLEDLPSAEAKTQGPKLARHLKIISDQRLAINSDSLSDNPAGELGDGLPPDVEQIGRIDAPGKPVDIRLRRVPREDGVKVWKFSAANVAAIPGLYKLYGYGLLGEVLPSVFFETEFLDTQLWQWVTLPILIGFGYALGMLVTTLGLRVLRRRESDLASGLNTFMAGPVKLLTIVLFLSIARRQLRFSLIAGQMLNSLEQILLVLAIAWTLLRVLEFCEKMVRDQAVMRGKTTLLPLLPVARKTAKILVAIFAGVAVLDSFGVNVITVLAGLGVGGIAVALAAQKTMENFIGSITLYVDQPVRVGDFCRFGGTIGTVEEVGLRSTRVRTLDRTVVTIPNSEFSNLQIESFASRNRIWYHPTIRLRYETTPDQIRYVLIEVRRMLYAHPKVDSGSARIRFTGFGTSSLDLDVFSYVNVTDYGEYLEIAEDLNLRVMDIVAAAGSTFAVPSQTTYIEKGWARDRDRARAAEEKVKEWRERRELCLPRFPQEKIMEIENTLEYPPDGSIMSTGSKR